MAASRAFSPEWPNGGWPTSWTSESLDEIDIQAKLCGDGAGDLCDFDGVGEAVAEVIGVAASEDLSLVFEAAEGARVDDAVTVALKGVAVRVRRLGKTASAGLF